MSVFGLLHLICKLCVRNITACRVQCVRVNVRIVQTGRTTQNAAKHTVLERNAHLNGRHYSGTCCLTCCPLCLSLNTCTRRWEAAARSSSEAFHSQTRCFVTFLKVDVQAPGFWFQRLLSRSAFYVPLSDSVEQAPVLNIRTQTRPDPRNYRTQTSQDALSARLFVYAQRKSLRT